MTKVTYTLDDETVATIRRAAKRANKAQSAIVREAVARYAAEPEGPRVEEIRRKLHTLDAIMALPSTRSVQAVDKELRAVGESRRTGWRRRGPGTG